MSRIGKQPINIPKEVSVEIKDKEVKISGPRGSLVRCIPHQIEVVTNKGEIEVKRLEETKAVRSLHGMFRALLANMVKGVVSGFTRVLEIEGVGYRVQKQGRDLRFSLGFSHPIDFPAPFGIEYELDGKNKIKIGGIDKELVGQTAAKIRALRKVEPYKGKGIRYEGEYVRRKVGKAAKASTAATA